MAGGEDGREFMTSSLRSKDFLAGLLFIGLGLFGLWLARDLESGTSAAMETGYFPRMICILLVLTGAAISAIALLAPGERAGGWHWRPLLLISISTLAFAFLLKPLGLVAAVVATTLLAGLAGRGPRLLPLAALAVVLVLATTGLFVLALRIPIPLWPTVL
jgi:hypothetical protein